MLLRAGRPTSIPNVGPAHTRTDLEWLADFHHLRRAAFLPAPGSLEWDPHRGRDRFQLPTRKAPEEDLVYVIALPKCRNDVVRA